MSFLDTLINNVWSTIEIDIYYNLTNSKQYQQFNSCQPKQTMMYILYSLAKRSCTIISNTESRNTFRQELKTTLTNRNYAQQFVGNTIQRVLKLKAQKLRHRTRKKKENLKTLPSISTHNSQKRPKDDSSPPNTLHHLK